jgi:sterol desaturase/sphingolipid hydroxylase (fatty acid hydroxylase superfamily)
MKLFALEHSRRAYCADFVIYGAAVIVLTAVLAYAQPLARWSAPALLGLAGWTLVEYAMHRFVLHGLRPFKAWHARHHERPTARIASPTILSAGLIVALVSLPAFALSGGWNACALTLGVLTGYLGYAITHHAVHHWNVDNAWLKRRKRAHALHHHLARPVFFGVTSTLWDHVFGSAGVDR